MLSKLRNIRYGALLLLSAVLLPAAFFLSGCERPVGDNPEDQVKYVIGMSQANLGEPWRVVMNREIMEEAAKHEEIKVIFTDAAQDSQKQVKDVEKLLGYGIDLLMISPNEAEPLTPIVEKAYEGIPVIVIDRDIQSEEYTMFIGANNELIGRQAGQFIAELLGDRGGNVVEIQGLPGSIPAQDRSKGFGEVIAGYKNIEIVDTVVADWLRDKAEDEVHKRIRNYSNVDVIYAHNDPMALGAYRAASKFGNNNIKFVGIDGLLGEEGGIQLVKEGILKATFTYPTGGKEAVQYAIKLLKGEKGLPKRITLESNTITE
ncbi:MAG TPA: substrate-binding domain-containing protein [Clostridia bacterium]|nr:substrate-binding domain-containing protein [Clostridia bacterium]